MTERFDRVERVVLEFAELERDGSLAAFQGVIVAELWNVRACAAAWSLVQAIREALDNYQAQIEREAARS